jgi:hypothetical protein
MIHRQFVGFVDPEFSWNRKIMINALQKSGRLAEAQTLILAELEKQYGGSAKKAAAEAGLGTS